MTDLDTQSSLAVQPELVLGQGRPKQTRIENYGVPITGAQFARVQHESHPVLVSQMGPYVMRVCTGIPLGSSFAVLPDQLPVMPANALNQIEWSWLPGAQWQVAIHRHGQGIGTSRGLYCDEAGWSHLYLKLPDQWPVYGLGEKTGELNKQGRRWSFWNSDVFEPHTDANDELYQSIPFMVVSTDQGWMGLFVDNPGRVVLDLSLTDELCISVQAGAIDLYIFSGEKISDVLDGYTRLTGRPYLPPKWALGYHQSRHSYETEQQVRDVVQGFIQHDMPVDAIYLDIMYMDGYRVFTFHPEHFQKAPELVDDLLTQGVRLVPIVDPGVKVDPEYRIYQQGVSADYFTHSAQGDVWKGQVWPGESAWPDFYQSDVRKWWKELHRYFTDMGVQGIWNDMNEPAVFNERMTIDADATHLYDGFRVEHEAVHNAYGLLMSEATQQAIIEQCGQRPFVLTRAGYAGIQRCATVWTGDNRSSWEHLRLSVPMLLNLGLSGVAFAGVDIGGFMNDTRPELFTRWMQLGVFYPFMRNHCSISQVAQEPWSFGDNWTPAIRTAMHRRYKMLPYLYQLMRDAHEVGVPVMRPMLWADDKVSECHNANDQFFVGDNFLVAPIVSPGTSARAVWLPKGRWLSVYSDQHFDGLQYVLAETGIDDIPVFLRTGAIVPLAPYRHSTAKPLKELRLLIVAGEIDNRILYRDDDGLTADPMKNRYARLSFGYHCLDKQIECHVSLDRSHYRPQWQQIVIGVPLAWRGKKMLLNGEVFDGKSTIDGLRCKLEYVKPSQWL
ncbi:glycoside hydrolase family 31 protein [Reinekea sp. G2M2-21]|uniref:glycoside hydrolase family 31 protein n=1 Tax=Reinekea sp. G2M2-21 TaxID=2788942 RepID=UPI0018A9AB31|nr:glycoside hydrolase family 31 protein [Reinekea sp. G2M2-21]